MKDQLRRYFHCPDLCEAQSTYLRDDLPKLDVEIKGTYQGEDIEVLYLEHDLAAGVLVILVCLGALFATLISSLKMRDISVGLALGVAILTAAGFISSVALGVACVQGLTGKDSEHNA